MADVLSQTADMPVTCGAPQSNHCRITLAAANKVGLKCRFVIEERVLFLHIGGLPSMFAFEDALPGRAGLAP